MGETARRRTMQMEHNKKHNITPQTIVKDTRSMLEITKPVKDVEQISKKDARKKAYIIEKQMKQAAMELEFETAAILRDELLKLNEILREGNQ